MARVPVVLVHQRERLRLELGGARPEAISQVSCDPHIQQVVACKVLEGIPRGTARDTKGPGDARRIVPTIPLFDAEGQDFQIFERTKVGGGKAREGHRQRIHGVIRMVTAAAGLRYPVLTLCTHGTPLATSLVEVAMMLWTLLVLVLLVWVIGFLFDVAGGLIHLLLLAALALLLFNLFSARRKAL